MTAPNAGTPYSYTYTFRDPSLTLSPTLSSYLNVAGTYSGQGNCIEYNLYDTTDPNGLTSATALVTPSYMSFSYPNIILSTPASNILGITPTQTYSYWLGGRVKIDGQTIISQ